MYVVSNWKMNLSAEAARELLMAMVTSGVSGVRRIVLPPYPLLPLVRDTLAASPIKIGGQDCHWATQGAYTGEVSAGMLAGAGCQYVLLGHSERRQQHNESNALIASKIKAAREAGLRVILCVGETAKVREAGEAAAYVTKQLTESLVGVSTRAESLLIAYEPIWAIGSGKIPNADEIAAMHSACQSALASVDASLAKCPILYGGSVNAENASDIAGISGVDGVLIGGASLKAEAINAIGLACDRVG